jgi:hypothetical protein
LLLQVRYARSRPAVKFKLKRNNFESLALFDSCLAWPPMTSLRSSHASQAYCILMISNHTLTLSFTENSYRLGENSLHGGMVHHECMQI